MVVYRLMGWHGFCMLKRSVNRCERFKKRLKWNNILAKGDVYIKKIVPLLFHSDDVIFCKHQ